MQKGLGKKCYWFLIGWFSSVCVFAQTTVPIDYSKHQDFYWKNWSSTNGLLQNTVKSLKYDAHGFLWITNEKGLSRFDGKKMKNYYGLPLSHVNHRVYDIEGKGDSIMIKARPRFVIKNGKLNYHPERKSSPGFFIPFQYINYFSGLVQKRYGRGHQEKIFKINDSCYYGLVARADSVMAISYFKGKQETPLSLPLPNLRIDPIGGYQQGFVFKNHLLWIHDSNLYCFDEDGFKTTFKLSFSSDFDACWMQEEGEVYFLDRGRLYQLAFDGETDLKLLCLMENKQLSSLSVVIHNSTFTNYSIGTDTQGFFQARKQCFSTIKPNVATSLTNIRSAYEIGEDSILFNTGLLVTNDGENTERTPFRDHLFLGSEGDLYSGNTLEIVKMGKDVIRQPILGKTDEARIENFIEDKRGRVWVGGKSLYFLRNDSLIHHPLPLKNKIKPNFSIHYDEKEDNIWCAQNNMVYVFSIALDSVVDQFSIPVRFINSIYISKENIAWINTRGEGMFAYKDDSIYRLPQDPNNYLQYAHSIREDDKGFFWISSDNGLFKVQKTELVYYLHHSDFPVYYYYFNKSWGFLNNEFNSLGFPPNLELRNGKFGFPSFAGLVVFNPDEVEEERHGDEIFVDNIRINDIDTTLSSNSVLDQNSLDIEFEIIHAFSGHSNNLYMQYKLEGYHENWLRYPESNTIHFSKLPHGSYVLRVRKRSDFGINQYAYLEYPFSIQKMVYETSWFRGVIVSIIGLLMFGAFLFRGYWAKKKQEELEIVIEDKTEEYRVLNEELNLNLARLRSYQSDQEKNTKSKNRMVNIYMHDIRGPLRFIKTIASKSIETLQYLDPEDIKEGFSNIHDSTDGVFQLTEKMFSWTQSSDVQFEIKLKDIKVKSVADEIIRQFFAQAKEKNILLKNEVKSDFVMHSEENLLIIIINNLVQNSIKYTQNGTITIDGEKIHEYKVLTISDTGVGIAANQLQQINDGNYKSLPGTENEIGKGFGLKVIKDFMEQLNGYLQITSEAGKGTRVKLFFIDPEVD